MMPLLAASEKGPGQTESAFERELEMWWSIISKSMSQSFLERNTLESDSLVDEIDMKVFKE